MNLIFQIADLVVLNCTSMHHAFYPIIVRRTVSVLQCTSLCITVVYYNMCTVQYTKIMFTERLILVTTIISKSALPLSTSFYLPIFLQAKPMVCVALEPMTHQDLPRLEAGLKSLYQVL
jgi:hypothetical protein